MWKIFIEGREYPFFALGTRQQAVAKFEAAYPRLQIAKMYFEF